MGGVRFWGWRGLDWGMLPGEVDWRHDCIEWAFRYGLTFEEE